MATKTYFFQIRHSCGKKVFYLVNRTEKFGLRFSIDPTGTLSAVVKLSDKEIANVQPDLQKELPENGVEDFQRTLANDLRQADSGEQNELLKRYFQSGI